MLKSSQETFNDGICKIYHTNEDGRIDSIPYYTARYHNRVVGFKRFYDAKATTGKISKLIRILYHPGIEILDKVEIFGYIYSIGQVQEITDRMPKVVDLTLTDFRKGKNEI